MDYLNQVPYVDLGQINYGTPNLSIPSSQPDFNSSSYDNSYGQAPYQIGQWNPLPSDPVLKPALPPTLVIPPGSFTGIGEAITGGLGAFFGGLFGGKSGAITGAAGGVGMDTNTLMLMMLMGGNKGGMSNMLLMMMLMGGLGSQQTSSPFQSINNTGSSSTSSNALLPIIAMSKPSFGRVFFPIAAAIGAVPPLVAAIGGIMASRSNSSRRSYSRSYSRPYRRNYRRSYARRRY